MKGDSSAVDPVPDHVIEASFVLARLEFELLSTVTLANESAAKLDSKTSPCTYQVFRFISGHCTVGIKLLHELCNAARVPLQQLGPQPPFVLSSVTPAFDTAESRVEKCIFGPFRLDFLPPGNPGEPEFEKLLKPLVATNRAYSALMHHLSVLHTLLFSDTYKIELPERERLAAWKQSRKEKLEKVLTDVRKQLEDNEKFVASLRATEAAILERIRDNEQMTFAMEIDKDKTPELGE